MITGRLLITFIVLALTPPPVHACSMSTYAIDADKVLNKLKNDPCADHGTSLVAHLRTRLLLICVGGEVQTAYPFSHGEGFYPKTREGDERTPVGNYPLSKPRPSNEGYSTFIQIGYPTAYQVERGYTGGAVGIHGPEREKKCNGLANLKENWTDGCLGLVSDESIAAVAKFVTAHPGIKIHLLDTH